MFFPLTFSQRVAIWALNAGAVAVVILLSRHNGEGRSGVLPLVRAWLPCLLIPFAYRESGLFVRPDTTHELDNLFIIWDRTLLENGFVRGLLSYGAPWLQYYLELAYLLCYPLIPLGFGVLLFARGRATSQRSEPPELEKLADSFWTPVLLAVLPCYVLFPFFPLTPPRVLFHDLPGPAVAPLLRNINFWVLDRYSVQACIFPSGHVAAVVGTALAVRAHLRRIGWLFLIAATSVTIATVVGRYHYAADAAAGALVGVAAFWVSRQFRNK